MNILKHLAGLTNYFYDSTNNKIPYIHVYSCTDGKKFHPVDANGEGKARVDDAARACILAFEIYEYTQDKTALETDLKWIKFLDYMTDDNNLMLNFIDEDNNRVTNTQSYYPGGAWWSSRAKHAYAKAFAVTKDDAYLTKYTRLKISEAFDSDIASILLIAGMEANIEEDFQDLYTLAISLLESVSVDGYMVHNRNVHEMHMWGYHEFEAYIITRKEKYKKMFLDCCAWFDGKSQLGERIYNRLNGACRDGIKDGKLSKDCGAESAIEAGSVELRRIILQEQSFKY